MTKKILDVIIDTRENEPLSFSRYDNIRTQKDTLGCGDYTLVGHDLPNDDHSIIIERKKDCQELVRNLGANWERFERQAKKMVEYKNRMIVVCSHNNFEWLYDQKYTNLHPNFIARQLAILQIDYQIPVLFLNNRDAAENFIFRMFWHIAKRTEEEH